MLRWYLACLNYGGVTDQTKGTKQVLSETRFPPLLPKTIFSRVLAVIDCILMTSATIATRNEDLPYFGL